VDEQPVLGIIGGSGLYSMGELVDIEERSIDTPFGVPSRGMGSAMSLLQARSITERISMP